MKDIFADASLTIVAACGDGAHTGLPGAPLTPRPPEQVYDFTLDLGDNDNTDAKTCLVPVPHSFNMLDDAFAWHTRGWTLCEYIFSRRLL